ncbi:MAG: hypothetical protein WAT52_03915 [Chitinophagales bacterium]
MKMIIDKEVLLDLKKNNVTGFTQHFIGTQEEKILAPIPKYLQIAHFENKQCYYLLLLDEDKNEITDTFHENITLALEQAKLEFNVNEKDWINLNKIIEY